MQPQEDSKHGHIQCRADTITSSGPHTEHGNARERQGKENDYGWVVVTPTKG